MNTKLWVVALLNMGGVLALFSAMSAPSLAAADPVKTAALPQAQRSGDAVWQVKKGDTLDRIISRRLASLPFKQDVLRQALADKNPGVFKYAKSAKTAKLIVGSTLLLPTLADFQHLLPVPAQAMLQQSEPQPLQEQAEMEENPRQEWVRFP